MSRNCKQDVIFKGFGNSVMFPRPERTCKRRNLTLTRTSSDVAEICPTLTAHSCSLQRTHVTKQTTRKAVSPSPTASGTVSSPIIYDLAESYNCVPLCERISTAQERQHVEKHALQLLIRKICIVPKALSDNQNVPTSHSFRLTGLNHLLLL